MLVLLSPLAWADKVLLSKEYQYKGYNLKFDTNNNGAADLTEYYSLSGTLLREEFDGDENESPEKSISHFKIRNVTTHVSDTNNDGIIDEEIYELGDRAYHFKDTNADEIYDQFDIYSEPTGRNTPIYVQDISYSYMQDRIYLPALFFKDAKAEAQKNNNESLVEFYEQELQHWNLVTQEKYRELETLFQEAKKTNKWEALLNKTREYLEYPSNAMIPIEIKLATPEEMGDAEGRLMDASILQFSPDRIESLERWLWMVDHELLHFVQFYRVYLMLKAHEFITWNEFIDLFKKIKQTSTDEEAEKLLLNIPQDKIEIFLSLHYILTNPHQVLLAEMEAYFAISLRFETFFKEYNEEAITSCVFSNLLPAMAHFALWVEVDGKFSEFYQPVLQDLREYLQLLQNSTSPEDFEEFERLVMEKAEQLRKKFDLETPPSGK